MRIPLEPLRRDRMLVLACGVAAAGLGGCGSRSPGNAASGAAADSVAVVPASPEKGFHYPYVLRIPRTEAVSRARFLLVEPNNTGTTSDDPALHLESAKIGSGKAIGGFVSRTLGLPLLVPAFPRPATEWQIYTHLLDRDAMLLPEGPMKRLDLQLLAMVEDARGRLAAMGIQVDPRILLTGFSASGAFSNRFTVLHPERVQGVASGGVNGLLMLPVASLGGTALEYPLGVADCEKIAGRPFDLAAWRQVPQFIYMGALDDNDAVQFDDGYSEDERSTVFELLGEKMQPDRWEKCQAAYREAGATVTFRTYAGIGHGTNRAINTEIAEFFRTCMNR